MIELVRPLAIAATLAVAITAQQASYTYIPQPPHYGNPSPPWLTATNLPRIGTTLELQVPCISVSTLGPLLPTCPKGGNQYRHYYLLTGLTNPNRDLRALGFPAVLFTSGELILERQSNSLFICTQPTVSLPIPNDPQLVGCQIFQQVAMVFHDTCTGDRSVQLGRGGHGVIGL